MGEQPTAQAPADPQVDPVKSLSFNGNGSGDNSKLSLSIVKPVERQDREIEEASSALEEITSEVEGDQRPPRKKARKPVVVKPQQS
jgi:hypothetical protein